MAVSGADLGSSEGGGISARTGTRTVNRPLQSAWADLPAWKVRVQDFARVLEAFPVRFILTERHYKKLLPLISHELHALSNVQLISLQLERTCASVGRIYVHVRVRSLTAVLLPA